MYAGEYFSCHTATLLSSELRLRKKANKTSLGVDVAIDSHYHVRFLLSAYTENVLPAILQ